MNKVKEWLSKYSMQMALATTVSGVIIASMPYFEAYLPQWLTGVIMTTCGILTAVARVLPQLTEE